MHHNVHSSKRNLKVTFYNFTLWYPADDIFFNGATLIFFSSYGYKYPPSRDINNYTNPQCTKLPLHRNGMKSTTEISIDNNLPR
jgi:hypothetical protein